MKTCWLQLYDYLERNNILDKKNIGLKYVKINNYHYNWSILNINSEDHYNITPLPYYDDTVQEKGNDKDNVTDNDSKQDVVEEQVEEW